MIAIKKNISEISRSFIAWVRELVTERGYILLNCKEYERAGQIGDKLLGYFDNNGVYLIPDKLFSLAENFLSAAKYTPIEIEQVLWYDKVILTEDDGIRVRYRRQKRIGKTKKRYLTFKREAIFSDEEQCRFIPCSQQSEMVSIER